MPKDFGIGASSKRREDVRFLTGNGKYTDDINIAKQVNTLVTEMELPADRIVMFQTSGALGYGIEHGYSVMERLRLAALQGDAMTQLPMLVTPGFEA